MIFSYAVRKLGWWIIKALAFISSKLEDVNDKIYSLLDFFNYKGVTELLDQFKPVIWAILFLSILYLALQFVINRRFQADN